MQSDCLIEELTQSLVDLESAVCLVAVMATQFPTSTLQGNLGRAHVPGRTGSFGFSGVNGAGSSSPTGLESNLRAGQARNEEVTSPSKGSDEGAAGLGGVSGKHCLRTLLQSSMFKAASDPFNKRNTKRGMKQWLLSNICYVFIVKAGIAELDTVDAGKQDDAIINEFYKPKDGEGKRLDFCAFIIVALTAK